MTDSKEIWKAVVGYEGWYEISNWGNIKRIKKGKGFKRSLLSPATAKIGYKVIVLSHGTILTRKFFYIHRLVANAFIGPCADGMNVNHIDANKLNRYYVVNRTRFSYYSSGIKV